MLKLLMQLACKTVKTKMITLMCFHFSSNYLPILWNTTINATVFTNMEFAFLISGEKVQISFIMSFGNSVFNTNKEFLARKHWACCICTFYQYIYWSSYGWAWIISRIMSNRSIRVDNLAKQGNAIFTTHEQ